MRELHGKSKRFRLSRFFHDGGLWYVELREGRRGPFLAFDQAVRFLERFKRQIATERGD